MNEDRVKSKLEKQYDEINDPNSKTLEEMEKVQIDKYQMKEGDYKILITVYQANDLEPKPAQFLFFDLNKTAVDAFVEIDIRGEIRKTAVRKQTNNPIWQESFYYQFTNLTVQDLDNSKIIFKVYDKNNIFLRNSYIGQIELDWTNIYFRRFHQIYRGWLTLSDPSQQNQGATGYLLVNIAVLGPQDKIMVHDTAFIKDPLTTIEDTITNTKLRLIDYSITVEVYRAESLIPLDLAARSVDAYVIAKFSGSKVQTPYVRKTLNPQWNYALKIGTGVPTKTKYLILEVWNHNYFSKDDLIGTIKIPFVDICQNVYANARWSHIYGPPMCAIDQPPTNYASKMQLYGQELGSHYRGRLLYKIVGRRYIHSNTGRTQIKFKFPYKPTPVVPLKTYTLSVQMIQGFHLPQRPQAFIQVAMGQYLIKQKKNYMIDNRICQFHDILQDKKVQFPEAIDQVPDIIIYLCDGIEQKNRMCFTRIKAKDVQTNIRNRVSKVYTLEGDKSLHLLQQNQIGGYLNFRINLYTDGAPMVKTIESQFIDKIPFRLVLYVFKGEDFPPAKLEGDCNPVLKFNCFGKQVKCTPKIGTFNPFWGQDIHLQTINMQDIFNTNISKGVVCQAFDHYGNDATTSNDKKDQFIGSFLIELNSNYRQTYVGEKQPQVQFNTLPPPPPVQFLYIKPKWYYIVNPHIQVGKNIFGRVLVGVALFREDTLQLQNKTRKGKIPRLFYDYRMTEQEKRVENEEKAKKARAIEIKAQDKQPLKKQQASYDQNSGNIVKEKSVDKKSISLKTGQKKQRKKLIQYQTKTMQIYVIGLRQIKDNTKHVLTNGKVELVMMIGDRTFVMKNNELKRSGCEINKLIELEIQVPKNKYLIPFIDFKVKYNDQFYGYNSANLYQLLPKLREKEGENNIANVQDSQETILDVETLQKQLEMLREKKRKQKEQKLAGNKIPEQKEDIMNYKAPFQLGLVANDKDTQNQQQFDDLLYKVNRDVETNQDFRYVKELEQAKDRKLAKRQSSHRLTLQKQQAADGKSKELIQQVDEQNQQQQQYLQDEEAELAYNNRSTSNMKPRQQSLSKAANVQVLTQTVFQRKKRQLKYYMKQKKLTKKQQNKNEVSNKEQKLLQKRSQKKSSQKQPPIKSIPKMIQEAPQTHERLIKVEIQPEETKKNGRMQESDHLGNNHPEMIEQSLRGDYKDLEDRYDINNRNQQYDRQQNQKNKVCFQIRTEQAFSDTPVLERAVTYKQIERALKMQQKDQKQALERDAQYRYAQAVKLSLFGWRREKKKRDIETYEDYDTQVGQDLNIIPQWYKGRKILTSDFQDLSFKSTKIQTIPLFGGRPLQNTTIYQRYKQSAGHVKLICLAENIEVARQKEQTYTKLLRPRQFFCRIYVLKGKSLISHYQGKPTTYLKFTYGDKEFSFQKTRTCQNQNNPQYYVMYEVQINLPGPSVIKVQVMENHDVLGKLVTKVLGYTEIDIEQRYFTRKWHLYEKKPIQLRNLYSEFGIGSQGRLQTWIDLIEKKKWISTPPHKIHPPPFDKYQLRVIVWKTDDCVYKNVQMESNDIFVRGVIGTSEPQETDTHWACRTVGNFNYRFKFPVFYPPKPEDMYSDIFAVQIWDRDLIGFNNLIGELRINMNKIHKIIQKAVKRRKTVKASMKIKEKNFAVTDRFWFDVFNNKEKDQFGIPQPQGRVQLSFQLVPFELAQDSLKNGYGRSEPNVYPTLAQPAGRLQFDFFSPLAFLKQILGPTLYRKCCCRLICCLLLLIIAFFGYIFFPVLIATRI